MGTLNVTLYGISASAKQDLCGSNKSCPVCYLDGGDDWQVPAHQMGVSKIKGKPRNVNTEM